MHFKPIGFVASSRKETRDDRWDSVESRIELDPERFTRDSLRGLDRFSHIEVVFLMHKVRPSEITTNARHPRGRRGMPKVGIFAQRAKGRPNRIGVTVCSLRAVEGLALRVVGLDAIDGTPVLDIKPWVREFGPRGRVRQPRWVSNLMKRYWR